MPIFMAKNSIVDDLSFTINHLELFAEVVQGPHVFIGKHFFIKFSGVVKRIVEKRIFFLPTIQGKIEMGVPHVWKKYVTGIAFFDGCF